MKSISRSLKISCTGDHHGTQMILNERSSGQSNDQFTVTAIVKGLIIPVTANYLLINEAFLPFNP